MMRNETVRIVNGASRRFGRWSATGAAVSLLVGFLSSAGGWSAVEAQEPLYDMLVSNRNTNSVKRFDAATGAYVDDFIRPGAGGIQATQEVLLAPDGSLIVSARFSSQILRFDARTGEYAGAFTSGYTLSEPTKMTWGPDDNLYVSQWGAARENVAVFGPDGVFIREATPSRSDPMQQAWDDDGTLLVVYFGSDNVRRFDTDGNQLEVFVMDDRLEGPVNLRWDADHNLHVFDWESNAVYRFDGETGAYLNTFISNLRSPEGWAIGPDGNLYIAEWAGNAVKRFNPETGALIDTFAQGNGLGAPNSILFVERPSVFELQPSTLEVSLGTAASTNFTIQVVGSRGVPFEQTVDLTCAVQNPDLLCELSPSSVTPGSTGASSTVTVSRRQIQQSMVPPGLMLLLVGLLALAWSRSAGVKRTRFAYALGILLLLSCGASGTEPDTDEPETDTVRITAASDGLTAEAVIDVASR